MDDYSLAPSYHAIITKSIQDQLSDFKAHSTTFGEDGVAQSPIDDVLLKGALENEDETWWESWRNKVHSEVAYKAIVSQKEPHSRKRRKVVKDENVDGVVPPVPDKDQPMSVDDFEEDESKALEEMRILIKVRSKCL